MIKKLLLGFAVVAISALAANAQPCTPNPQYVDSLPGVWPDEFPVACKNADYNLTIDIKTLNDTSVTFSGFPLSLYIKALRVKSLTGLPNGFSYAPAYNGTAGVGADNFPAWVNGGATEPWTKVQGCVQVSALASAVAQLPNGDNAITVEVDIFAKNKNTTPNILQDYIWTSNLSVTVPYTFNLVVSPCTDIEENGANKFTVAQNFPNPFTGNTSIPFNTAKEEQLTFKVYNMLGMLVHENNFISKAGKNIYIMDASKYNSGMYVFTMSNGEQTFTRKMTIQN